MNPSDGGCSIERWKSDLVRARAVRLGFRGADLNDVQQEVLLEVMGFQFQPTRANGATEATALTALIDRRLCMARRRQHRYQRRLEQIYTRANADGSSSGMVEVSHETQIDRNLDVQTILAKLEPEDRSLCEMLSAGQSIEAIADQLGCGWHTVKRRIDRLRQFFEEAGLDSCVN